MESRVSDWPSLFTNPPAGGTIHSAVSPESMTYDAYIGSGGSLAGGGAWPASNRALYFPFCVENTVTAYKMAFEVTTQSGNCDVGIYDSAGNRLVSAGSTAVAVAGIQIIDITDTVLTPGCYFMAMNVDNTTAAFVRTTTIALLQLETCGVQQEAVGAVALPDPATFANPAAAYTPGLVVATQATI